MMKAPDADGSRRRACWNIISVSATLVGFLFGFVVAINAPHMQQGVWGFRVWFGFATFGLLAGLNALVRAERWWAITATGLLLNLVVLAVTWELAIHGR
jgi:hypothetical protein